MGDRPPIRVVVAEDDPIMLEGLSAVIGSNDHISIVGRASNGAEAVRIVEESAPDVVVMDIQMPILDGVTATAHIKALDDPPRVLVLTVFGDNRNVQRAFQAGADGFLLKRVGADELHAAIERVVDGDALVDPAVTRQIIDEYLIEARTDNELLARHHLTRREVDVLGAIAAGCSNADIASHLSISEHTVKTHVSSVLAKTASQSRVQAVIFAYNAGLVRPTTLDA